MDKKRSWTCSSESATDLAEGSCGSEASRKSIAIQFMANLYLRTITLAIALLAFFVGFYRPHTPNFGWGNVLSNEILPHLTHADLFWNIRIPVFRPSLHIEKILTSGCGQICAQIYNSFIWGICFFVYLIMLSWISRKIFSSKRTYAILVVLTINAGVIVYSLFFSYGSFVDILYALAVSGLALIALNKDSQICKKQYFIIAITSIFIFIADNSRPYFLYIFPIWILIFLVQKRKGITIGLLIGALFCTPYHFAQFVNTGSITLSNYSGCNIAEVFKPPNEDPISNYLPSNVNSDEVTLYCLNRVDKIKTYLIESPLKAINDVTEMPRLIWIIAPPPFVPDVFNSQNQIWRMMVWVLLITSLYLPLVALAMFFVVRTAIRRKVDEILVYLAIFMPLIFAIFAHGGWESGRVQMAFFYPLAVLNISLLTTYQSACITKQS